MREKLSDKVLTETQNRYNRPENCEYLSITKVSHLIGDKLKPETRSNDIKLQRVQSALIKGVTSMVCLYCWEPLWSEGPSLKKCLGRSGINQSGHTDAIALIGGANFELNMRRQDNIKPELNEDYKHLCSSTVPFTESLSGDDSELSKHIKDLALRRQKLGKSEATPKWTPTNTRDSGISSTPSLKDLDTNTEVKRRTQTSSYTGKGLAPHTTNKIKRGGGKANRAINPSTEDGKWFMMVVSGW